MLDPRLLVTARQRLSVSISRLLSRRLARIPVERVAGIAAVRYDSASQWINSSPNEDVPLEPSTEPNAAVSHACGRSRANFAVAL